MDAESIIYGFKYANNYNLTQKEREALVHFIPKPKTTSELAVLMNCSTATLHHIIGRLKLKKLLLQDKKNKKKEIVYKFNVESL